MQNLGCIFHNTAINLLISQDVSNKALRVVANLSTWLFTCNFISLCCQLWTEDITVHGTTPAFDGCLQGTWWTRAFMTQSLALMVGARHPTLEDSLAGLAAGWDRIWTWFSLNGSITFVQLLQRHLKWGTSQPWCSILKMLTMSSKHKHNCDL